MSLSFRLGHQMVKGTWDCCFLNLSSKTSKFTGASTVCYTRQSDLHVCLCLDSNTSPKTSARIDNNRLS